MEEREYTEEEFKNNPQFQHHKPIEQVINMKKMKPFNLEAAKAGKPVCTRDGRKVRIICFDRIYTSGYRPLSIVALVLLSNGQESIYMYYNNGRYDPEKISDLDLMMLCEKKEGWVNVYYNKSQCLYYFSAAYKTKEEALDTQLKTDCIDTIKVEWEE